SNPCFAIGAGGGYHYVDGGGFYNDVTIPLDVAKDINSEENETKIVPISDKAKNNAISEKILKSVSVERTNILGLVELGDAGIYNALKKSGIKTVHYIEVKKQKVYIPLIFIPIYFNKYITTVYGE
ncbi:MAG: TRL domain-containing protein, partial [Candidatus Gastranaerophilales bacterium]|nr:TRL domain-containing protein [Candidatus Gastranaerophilales bacterium]